VRLGEELGEILQKIRLVLEQDSDFVEHLRPGS
jgi:hypothetical protein